METPHNGEFQVLKLNTFIKRFWGLMGKKRLQENCLYMLTPCSSIHTFFMCLEIDVLFLSKDGVVMKLYKSIPPGKVLYCKGAESVLEGAVGSIEKYQLAEGQSIYLTSIML